MENGSRGRRRGPPVERTRRSTRTAVLNASNKREASEDPWADWRGERRSTRLGAPVQTQFDDDGASARKRARTDDSSMSTHSMDVDEDGNAESSANGKKNALKLKSSSAAALKPNEVALEQVAGKKKSKFWVYAVEPVESGQQTDEDVAMSEEVPDDKANDEHHANGNGSLSKAKSNGLTNGTYSASASATSRAGSDDDQDYDAGSLSPVDSD
jgi:DNA segregation ATPase FtsK/SpoIIIE-like protein